MNSKKNDRNQKRKKKCEVGVKRGTRLKLTRIVKYMGVQKTH